MGSTAGIQSEFRTEQTVFTVVNCTVVGLSVFYSLVVACSLILLQLRLLGRSVECILHLRFKLEC